MTGKKGLRETERRKKRNYKNLKNREKNGSGCQVQSTNETMSTFLHCQVWEDLVLQNKQFGRIQKISHHGHASSWVPALLN